MGKRQARAGTRGSSDKNKNKAKTRFARAKGQVPALSAEDVGLARPLDTLAFLLPWILFYQVCLLVNPPGDAAGVYNEIVAVNLLKSFFGLFGTRAAIMPGLAVVIILICTQVASRRPWRVHKRSVAWMYAESILLAMPLLLLNSTVQGAFPCLATEAIDLRPWLAEVTLSIGAGIYEELVFRLVLIAMLVMIGADVLRLPRKTVTIVAVLCAAVLFAAHHHPPLGAEPFRWPNFTFRVVAGTYLGAVFVWRGYGPAAGLHIAYNLLLVLLG
jgi:membrane protease YdiL (CAAX protease family)